MEDYDDFNNTMFYPGSWTYDVSYFKGDGGSEPPSLTINSLPDGTPVLDGTISAIGDIVKATWTTTSTGPQFTLELTAVCDIAGATVFMDGGDQYYVFASFQLVSGAVYKTRSGFGHFNDPPTSDVACFAAETTLLGERGPARVDSLRPGDLLLTGEGTLEPIQWIGWRSILAGCHSERPVVILPGAFADDEPNTMLRLSPNHATLFDGCLIPIKHLVNQLSILWPCPGSAVTYYHVEFNKHAIVFANGLPVESFLNTNGRDEFPRQFGYFDRIRRDWSTWALDSCAPLALNGAVMERARHLVERQSCRVASN